MHEQHRRLHRLVRQGLIYSLLLAVAILLISLLARRLERLNRHQLRLEADFRYGLVRVREHADVGLTPFILLTSLQERRDMRQGMNLGADDYITKPLRPRELIDAVAAQLGRQAMRQAARALQVQAALTEALEEQAWALQEQYEKRLARELSEQWPGESRGQQEQHHRQIEQQLLSTL